MLTDYTGIKSVSIPDDGGEMVTVDAKQTLKGKIMNFPHFHFITNEVKFDWFNIEWLHDKYTARSHYDYGDFKIFNINAVFRIENTSKDHTWINLFDIKGTGTHNIPYDALQFGRGFLNTFSYHCSHQIRLELRSNGQVFVQRTWDWKPQQNFWAQLTYFTM